VLVLALHCRFVTGNDAYSHIITKKSTVIVIPTVLKQKFRSMANESLLVCVTNWQYVKDHLSLSVVLSPLVEATKLITTDRQTEIVYSVVVAFTVKLHMGIANKTSLPIPSIKGLSATSKHKS